MLIYGCQTKYMVKPWLFQNTKKDLKLVSTFFLSNFYFSPNDSPSKTMENVFYFIKEALFVLKIFDFMYFCLPLFFLLSAPALLVDPRKTLKFMSSTD